MFGLFKKDRDTSSVDELLKEIHRLGSRMSILSSMGEDERATTIRVFKLDILIDSVREMQSLLVEVRSLIENGNRNSSDFSSEISELTQSLTGYHHYLDVLSAQGEADALHFVERPNQRNYFG